MNIFLTSGSEIGNRQRNPLSFTDKHRGFLSALRSARRDAPSPGEVPENGNLDRTVRKRFILKNASNSVGDMDGRSRSTYRLSVHHVQLEPPKMKIDDGGPALHINVSSGLLMPVS